MGFLDITMAGTKDNTPNGTERPGNGAEARSNTQEKRSHSGWAQAGSAEDKVFIFDLWRPQC